MIIITGGSRGIGKYLLNTFLENDNVVFATYNSTTPENNIPEIYTKVDLTDYSAVSGWIKQITKNQTNLVLLNCMGINYNALAHNADISLWSNIIDTNLTGTYNVIRAVLPIMRKQQYGRIINFASVVAQIGVPGTSAYAASKSGLWGMTKSISAENLSKGITINTLNLGYFDIGMIRDVPYKYQQSIKEKIPTGNFGHPKNIKHAVNFLIQADYVSGSSIDINGGLF